MRRTLLTIAILGLLALSCSNEARRDISIGTGGPAWEVVLTMVSCGAGLLAFAAALDRFFIRRATVLETALFVVAAGCLFWPDITLAGEPVVPAYITDLMGVVSLAGAILLQRRPGPGGNRTASA